MLFEARKKGFQNRFVDFVHRLEKDGKAGSYIARSKKAALSRVRFNGIRLDLNGTMSNIYHTDAGFYAESANRNDFQSCEPDGKNELCRLSYPDRQKDREETPDWQDRCDSTR